MTLYDRKYNYNEKNMSLCEINCTLKYYDSNISKVICDCKIKLTLLTYDDLTENNFLNKIENSQSKTNFNIMKCYNSFSSEDIKNNSGFYTLLIIIIFFIIVMIIFCCKGYKSLEDKIDEVIYNKFRNKKRIKTEKIIKNDKIKINLKNKKRNKRKKDNTKSKINLLSKNLNKQNNDKDLLFMPTSRNDTIIKFDNDYELNNLSFIIAIKYDKRTFCDYYCSLIKMKQIIYFSFCDFNDYNSGIIKKFIFFLSFALHYTINALFFTDKTMHQIYVDEGEYNFSYQSINCFSSAIISTIILRIILVTLVLTEKSILEVKKQETEKSAKDKKKKVLKNIIIKYIIFTCLNFALLITFWYYLTCFNAVYINTQITLIINSIISFGFSLIYPFIINIFPSIFRFDAMKIKQNNLNKSNKKKKNITQMKKDTEYIYKASQILQIL